MGEAIRTSAHSQNIWKMTIKELCKQTSGNLLNIYFTAGFPELNSMQVLLEALAASSVDMVEIGIPYSDPLSDGPVIQDSNSIALKNGISLNLIFDQLSKINTSTPKIMMGYYNTILQFGMEKFCQKCPQTGVSGIILPDLPIDLWLMEYKSIFDKYDLSNIFLITPETSTERIHYIDENSTSFIYAVSSSGTTGTKQGIQGAESYLKRIHDLSLKHPVLVGFNISKTEDFDFACRYAQGGIIGSAFIKHIKNSNKLFDDTQSFVSRITQNTRS